MAVKKAETSGGQTASSQDVVDLLTEILDAFKKQVQSKTPPPLGQKAQDAVDAFIEISEALDVKPKGSTQRQVIEGPNE